VSGDFGPDDPRAEEFADDMIDEGIDPASESPDAGEVVSGEIVDEDSEVALLARVERERDEYLDALRRLQAEFDNYRKRTARQQTDLLARATESLIERLLPVLDALDLAVAHAAPTEDGEPDGLAGALTQIGTMAHDTLAKEGLERIAETEVEFDPTIHDAVAHVPSEDDSPGHLIDDVLRPGYRLRDRVLRPAMVRVRG